MNQTVSQTKVSADVIEKLMVDIRRYLETVALFRELGHEPSWRAEAVSSELVVRVRAWLEPCEPRMSGT